LGRVLPTAEVSYPVAQLGGQLSGGEIARPTGAGRPKVDVAVAELAAAKLSIDVSLHEHLPRHHHLRGAVAPGRLGFEHHLASVDSLHAFMGQRLSSDVAAELFQPLAVVCLDSHDRM
jgi:hypothetical protein